MSYSYTVKQALNEIKIPLCCRKSQLLGFLFFASDGKIPLRFSSAHKDLFDGYVALLRSVCKADAKITQTEGGTYRFEADEENSQKLAELVTAPPLFDRGECCLVSFMRGCFLSGGFIADPKTRFHLEILLHENADADLFSDIASRLGLPFRRSKRGHKIVFYMKRSDDIGDFLAVLGLHQISFDYLNTNIEKDIINTVNRQMNCETGNINKTVEASKKQRDAIDFFAARGFEGLTQPLINVARARLDNPSSNLAELSSLMDPPVSKSGVAHRLNRIIALYEEIIG